MANLDYHMMNDGELITLFKTMYRTFERNIQACKSVDSINKRMKPVKEILSKRGYQINMFTGYVGKPTSILLNSMGVKAPAQIKRT